MFCVGFIFGTSVSAAVFILNVSQHITSVLFYVYHPPFFTKM